MHLDDVLTELVEHCGDRLLRVACQLIHDAAAAQDLVQEALLRVCQSVCHRGLAPDDWYAYLRRAVINEYVRTRRLRSLASRKCPLLPVPCLNGYRTLPQHCHRLSRSRRSRDVLRRDAGLEGRNLLRLG